MKGELHVFAKLTEEDVREIYRRHVEGGERQKDLAAEFGVHPMTVNGIFKGETWKRLGLERPKKERHHNAKMTNETVKEMRERFARGGISRRQLAIAYGIGDSTAREIIEKKTWRHVV